MPEGMGALGGGGKGKKIRTTVIHNQKYTMKNTKKFSKLSFTVDLKIPVYHSDIKMAF